MNWLFLVIISAITNSLARILQKVLLVNKDNDPFAFGFVFQLIVSFIMLVWAIATGFHIPNLLGLWPNLILMSLLYALGNLAIFYAFKTAEASEVSVIFASSTMWSVLSAVILLSEKVTLTKIIATIFIVFGVVIVYCSKSKWKLNRGHLFALLSALFFGLAFTNDAFVLREFTNVPSYMFIAFLFPSFTILLFRPQSISNLSYYLDKATVLKTFLAAFFYGIAAVTIFQAFKSGGEASVISPIAQTSVIITVLMGYIFLKERERLLNKVIGAILVFIGVLLVK